MRLIEDEDFADKSDLDDQLGNRDESKILDKGRVTRFCANSPKNLVTGFNGAEMTKLTW